MGSRKKRGGGETWEKGEEILQGVILADSFNFKFLPITLERPRALLPLVNCPLLDYTVEFLVEAGVEEIFVFCCAHADQIVKHLSNSKWSAPRSPCEIHTVIVEDCLSTGDALREIDRKSLIRSDFVLVSGDVVSNMKLEQVLNEHKCKEDDTVVALDSSTNSICEFQNFWHCDVKNQDSIKKNLHAYTCTVAKFHIDWINTVEKEHNPDMLGSYVPGVYTSLFADNSNIQLRYDLLDCNICICSTQVPHLFTDNFDYQTRHDFIKGILVNEEDLLLFKGITLMRIVIFHVLSFRLWGIKFIVILLMILMQREFPTYMSSISKDILHRWAYPIVPDNSSFFMEDSYSYIRHNLYLDKDLSLARDCLLRENLVIGCGTSVGTGTVITNTVIGKNCVIGDNVQIEGAHLWENVIVENNCCISDSILCSGVHIKKNVTISGGSLISFNVVIGPDIVLKPGVKLTLKLKEDEDDIGMEDLSLQEKTDKDTKSFNTKEVGEEGQGYLWLDDTESFSDDDEDQVHDVWGINQQSSSEDDVSSISSEESNALESPPPEDSRLFYDEVLETIRHGVADKVSPDNMVLEINASKFAYNVTFRDVNQSMTKAVLETSLSDSSMEKQKQAQSLKKTIVYLKPVLVNYIKDVDGQKDLIRYAEEFFAHNKWCNAMLQVYLHHLYNEDVLDETVILHWHANPDTHDDQVVESQKTQLREMVCMH
ncbi:hypothetical protein QZH41_009445 [Actinostola sp. cb2023]|nr:hypothetical protein QZH41_009445 [Actinostola sp. cb2023]